ncbi:MAG: hypothetical protein HY052_01610 [Proteobacteria bacterium]|nr:hypothetical protein [Pseudomonadota bacterium]
MTSLPSLRVDERSVRRLRLGYPWVFRSEVINSKDVAALSPGQLVDFVRDKGDFVARGFLNPKPQLVGRVLTLQEGQAVDKQFIFVRSIQREWNCCGRILRQLCNSLSNPEPLYSRMIRQRENRSRLNSMCVLCTALYLQAESRSSRMAHHSTSMW